MDRFDRLLQSWPAATFPVNGSFVTEALQLMEEGAKWQVFVPSNLAYGERGAGRRSDQTQRSSFEMNSTSVTEKKTCGGKENSRKILKRIGG